MFKLFSSMSSIINITLNFLYVHVKPREFITSSCGLFLCAIFMYHLIEYRSKKAMQIKIAEIMHNEY